MKDDKTDLGEVHGGAVSLSAEDGPAVYHKLPGSDLPEYATVLKVLNQGHDGCKKACDAGASLLPPTLIIMIFTKVITC